MALTKVSSKTISDNAITADKIQSGTVTAADISDNSITVNKLHTQVQGALGTRNLIINGDMRIDQRNAGTSITANNQTFVVDRFKFRTSQSSKMTAEQVTDVPSGQGFKYSTKITSSSSYTVLSTDFFNIQHLLEVQNIDHLMFGSSNAKTVTLSFWVKSSLTGSFAVSLNNVGASPSVYPAEYIINTANTWEKKTITVEGDTTGTYNTGANSAGLGIIFNLGYGSNYEGTKNSWNASDANTFSGAVNLVETNGATLYITGVQLEVGTEATPFEHRPYDMELHRCKRYFHTTIVDSFKVGIDGQGGGNWFIQGNTTFPNTMRVAPTLKAYAYGHQANAMAPYGDGRADNMTFYQNGGTVGYPNHGGNLDFARDRNRISAVSAGFNTTAGVKYFCGFTADAEL